MITVVKRAPYHCVLVHGFLLGDLGYLLVNEILLVKS